MMELFRNAFKQINKRGIVILIAGEPVRIEGANSALV